MATKHNTEGKIYGLQIQAVSIAQGDAMRPKNTLELFEQQVKLRTIYKMNRWRSAHMPFAVFIWSLMMGAIAFTSGAIACAYWPESTSVNDLYYWTCGLLMGLFYGYREGIHDRYHFDLKALRDD